jgi:hypothetical protein
MKHETSKHHQMQASKRDRKPLIIAQQPKDSGGPGEGALRPPSPRQQDKAAFGFWQFDHFQLDTVLLGLSCRNVTGIALVHVGAPARAIQRKPLKTLRRL